MGIGNAMKAVYSYFKDIFSGGFLSDIGNLFSDTLQYVIDQFMILPNYIKDQISTVVNGIKDVFSKIFSGDFSGAFDVVGDVIRSLIDRVKDFLIDLIPGGRWLANIFGKKKKDPKALAEEQALTEQKTALAKKMFGKKEGIKPQKTTQEKLANITATRETQQDQVKNLQEKQKSAKTEDDQKWYKKDGPSKEDYQKQIDELNIQLTSTSDTYKTLTKSSKIINKLPEQEKQNIDLLERHGKDFSVKESYGDINYNRTKEVYQTGDKSGVSTRKRRGIISDDFKEGVNATYSKADLEEAKSKEKMFVESQEISVEKPKTITISMGTDKEVTIGDKFVSSFNSPQQSSTMPTEFAAAAAGGLIEKTGLVQVHAGEVIGPLKDVRSMIQTETINEAADFFGDKINQEPRSDVGMIDKMLSYFNLQKSAEKQEQMKMNQER